MRDRAATTVMLGEALVALARRAATGWWRLVTTPRPDPWADAPVAVAPVAITPDPEGTDLLKFVEGELSRGFAERQIGRGDVAHVQLRDGRAVLVLELENAAVPYPRITVRTRFSAADARKIGRSLVAAAEELEVSA